MEIAGAAQGGEPPVVPPLLPAPGVVVPELPFESTPGSLTGWLTVETMEMTDLYIRDFITEVQSRYEGIPDEEVDAVGRVDAIRDLAAGVLGATEFSGFLSVASIDGSPATVSIVSNMARYSAGLGAASTMSGRVFGFLGETVEEQLPPLVMVPRPETAFTDLFTPRESSVPTRAEILAHYGTANPSTLMPLLPAAAPTMLFCPVILLPTPWVPYFLDTKSPLAAWELMTQLVGALPTEVQRDQAEYFVEWCAAACIRSGNGALQRRISALNVAWESPTAIDRKVMSWAKRRLEPFRIMPATNERQAANPVDPATLLAGLAGAGGLAQSGTKPFSDLEHDKLRSMASLTEAQYETQRPPIYATMLTEGRTMTKVDGVLHQYLAADEDADAPVHIFISQDMVRDVKDLRFSWNADYSFETCAIEASPPSPWWQ